MLRARHVPLPSGAGLHVGHPLGYIASDSYARFRRMQGDNVLHPFGFDAFGLPAEQYAIETASTRRSPPPRTSTPCGGSSGGSGLAHDPRRALSTADPRTTGGPRIFLQLFGSWFDADRRVARPIAALVEEFDQGLPRAGLAGEPFDSKPWSELDAVGRRRVVDSYRLAYLDEAPVNWCPGLGTVLANEEVTVEGLLEIGNYPVYRRRLRQWMLRITAYADRLLHLTLEWTDSLKAIQRNWIGRSEGADIRFTAPAATGATAEIVVYTTRPDTVFARPAWCWPLSTRSWTSWTAPGWPPGTPRAWQARPRPGRGRPRRRPRPSTPTGGGRPR